MYLFGFLHVYIFCFVLDLLDPRRLMTPSLFSVSFTRCILVLRVLGLVLCLRGSGVVDRTSTRRARTKDTPRGTHGDTESWVGPHPMDVRCRRITPLNSQEKLVSFHCVPSNDSPLFAGETSVHLIRDTWTYSRRTLFVYPVGVGNSGSRTVYQLRVVYK